MKNILHIFLIFCFSLSIVSCGEKDASSDGATSILSAPDDLTASGGWNTVTLDWDSVTGATSYTLYWDTTTGVSASSTSITSITTDNYTHSGLDNGTTSYYKVAAINSSGTGTLSSEANARTAGASAGTTLIGGSIQGIELTLSGIVTTIAGPAAGSADSGSTDGTGNDARFYQPFGMMTDGINLYIVEYGNHKIRKLVLASREVTTFAGPPAGTVESGSTDNATPSNARFNLPLGITTDGPNFYVADWGNHKIRKIVISTGEVTTFAGSGNSGSADNATGTSATFQNPMGITTDGTNLYVTDALNHKIRKIVIDNGTVTTFAGPPAGTVESGSTDNATPSNARFNRPYGITTDGTNLYVAEAANNKIRKIVIDNGTVTTLAGPAAGSAANTVGDTDGTGNAARFRWPAGITTDGTNLYVADWDNHKIRKIVIDNGTVTTLVGPAAGSQDNDSTDGTGNAARFWGPIGITTDGTYLYVTEYSNNKVRRIE